MKVNIFRDPHVQNDGNLPNSRGQFIVCDNERRTSMAKNVAIARDWNVIKKEAKLFMKYTDLPTEIQCTENVTTKVVPVIMEPCETHS